MRIREQRDIEEGVRHLVAGCAIMRGMASQCQTIPLRLSTADFAGLAAIIVSQQVSKASADAIFGRLRAQVDPLTAENFLAAGYEAWVKAGLSRPKQRTLGAIAETMSKGDLDPGVLGDLDPETAMGKLVAIKGIGPWTAEVYLLFCAGHADIFPAGDLALQEAIRLGTGMAERPGEKEAREFAQRWTPWRSVAARVLWSYYAVVKRDAAPV